MRNAVIVEAVRTPVGRRGGGLSGVHPADLGAHVLRAIQAEQTLACERVNSRTLTQFRDDWLARVQQ